MEKKETSLNNTHTFREISQQPEVWKKEYERMLVQKKKIADFMSKHLVSGCDVVLTGAGTSAFIGNALQGMLLQRGVESCRAVATTDIITHPAGCFSPSKPLLLVSFARSGNSPESLEAVKLANQYCKKVAHIIITCNEDGSLAKDTKSENVLVLLLSPETNDVSLAMTSSFSTMMLVAMLAFDIEHIEKNEALVNAIVEFAQYILEHCCGAIEAIAQKEFSRAVFLGSGELKSIAEECHLKLQELTDGKVICKFDSFLGFRHGPKAVLNSQTVLVYLLSSLPHVHLYERDLVQQINMNNKVVAQIAISTEEVSIPNVTMNLTIGAQNTKALQNNMFSCIPYVLVGQLLGFYKSLNLGLNPDAPSTSGNIARVVEGVKIYDNIL